MKELDKPSEAEEYFYNILKAKVNIPEADSKQRYFIYSKRMKRASIFYYDDCDGGRYVMGDLQPIMNESVELKISSFYETDTDDFLQYIQFLLDNELISLINNDYELKTINHLFSDKINDAKFSFIGNKFISIYNHKIIIFDEDVEERKQYSYKYDCWYDSITMTWLEHECSDSDCCYCQSRPKTVPKDINDQDNEYMGVK